MSHDTLKTVLPQLSNLIFAVAYRWLDGPFRDCHTAVGVDPRTDAKHLPAQMVEIPDNCPFEDTLVADDIITTSDGKRLVALRDLPIPRAILAKIVRVAATRPPPIFLSRVCEMTPRSVPASITRICSCWSGGN